MLKRSREADEVVEVYSALLRQSGSRAIERIRQRRRSILPIDALVICYSMWFLDTRAFPPVSYIAQAQRIVTEAIERVSLPQHYEFMSLPTLVEWAVAENTSEVMQQTLASIEEFVDARDALGRWIDENSGGGGGGDDEYNYNDDNEEERDSAVELVGILWRSAFFWVAVLEYIEALSLSSASVNAFALRPRYEQQLMNLLNSLAAPRMLGHWPSPPRIPESAPATIALIDANGTASTATVQNEVIKKEAVENNDDGGATPAAAVVAGRITSASSSFTHQDKDSHNNHDHNHLKRRLAQSERAAMVTRLLADLSALANCPADNPTVLSSGVNPTFYAMVHARLNVLAACERLDRFGKSAAVAPPPLTPSLQALQTQREAIAAGRQRREVERENRDDIGVPLDFVPNESYMRAALEKQNDTLGEDEELFKDEIMDYYKRQQQQQQQPSAWARVQAPPHSWKKTPTPAAASGREGVVAPAALVKPHRFCKVKTGYTWTQYNRTHYDARTNPPPRSVLWYEFTLFYPALANTKRDMSRIYRIEDTSRGPNDTYCILVFSVGPPYADVAYQIVRKQWDPRPGGVRASFDSSGTYRLFFRFTNSNYRR